MGTFGDDIKGNFFSPEMSSSTRYFSKNNEYNQHVGGVNFGLLANDHRTDPVHGIEYVFPAKYLLDPDLYRIHFVVYSMRLKSLGG